MNTFLQWKQEQESLRRLREMVEHICADIIEGVITEEVELDRRVDTARAFCKGLLPDKLDVFNLIYQGRFRRLWGEFGPQTATGSRRRLPEAAAAMR